MYFYLISSLDYDNLKTKLLNFITSVIIICTNLCVSIFFLLTKYSNKIINLHFLTSFHINTFILIFQTAISNLLIKHTTASQFQLSADYHGIHVIPHLVTNSTPLIIEANLHMSFHITGSTYQSDFLLSATYFIHTKKH